MRTTIDGAGRVVVPKSIRDRLGLTPGHALDIVERDGRVEMQPLGPKVWIEKRDGRPVAVTEGPVEPLTVDDVRAAVERLRR